MSKETPQFVFHAATRFLSGTLLSRISGLLRDMTMAFCLGTSSSLAAFLVAYRFIYLIRRLFGEGLLHQGFIPHFESTRSVDGKKGALFFRDLFVYLVGFLGTILFVGGVVLANFHSETAELSLLMLPGVLFLCLFGLSTALLQAEKRFFLPSVSPVIFNLIWILGVLIFRKIPAHEGVRGLSLTLSVAFLAQWLVTVPHMWRFLKDHLQEALFTKTPSFARIKPILRPLMLGIIGVASMQINSAIDAIFARFADPEGPAYLWYAIRLQQLPLALFGVALSSALLPSFSRAIKSHDLSEYNLLFTSGCSRIFSLIFPCAVGIFVLGLASVNLLFGRGDFSQMATFHTTRCLWGYGLGLMPASFVLVLAPAFYAKKDYKTPTWGFALASLLNIALNAFFVFLLGWKAASIALGTSVAALFNALFLYSKLGLKVPFKSFFRLALCALLAGAITAFLGAFCLGDKSGALLGLFPFELTRQLTSQTLMFALQTILYFLLFFSFCKIARVEERKHWMLWKEF